MDNCQHCSIENVQIEDSQFWACHIYRSEHISVRRLVVINPHLHTTDGIDVDSSQNVNVEDCTIHSGDDGYVVKCTGMHRENRKTPRNITFKGGVILSGCTMKIGSETWSPSNELIEGIYHFLECD